MRTIVLAIGMLTLAQWVFVLLLHGFLTVQEKRSPETLSRLHDVPVIGGYFPAVELEDERDERQEQAAEAQMRLLDAKRYYDLPQAFDEVEFQKLMDDIRAHREDLANEKARLEERWHEIRAMTEEIGRRELTVNTTQTELDKVANRLDKQQREMELSLTAIKTERDDIEAANLKKMAKWLDNVRPEKIAEVLLAPTSDTESAAQRDARYLDAAKVLSLMDDEVVSKVIEILDPLDWVRIEEKKKQLPVKKK